MKSATAVGQDPALEVTLLAQVPLDEARDGIPVRLGLPHPREPTSKCPWTSW